MILSDPQVILAFEPAVGSRDERVLLRLFHSELEYFQAKPGEGLTFRVQLPRPFQETALMDAPDWRQRPRRSEPARDLGYRMWMNLPPMVHDAIRAGSVDRPQHLAVLSTGSGMDDVPWEWLNDGPEDLIAATDSVRFVRLVPTLYAPPPMPIALPLRVLIVLTNPKDERLLQPSFEVDIVRQGLQDSQEYEVMVFSEPGLHALREALEAWSPHIVHYIGHSGLSRTSGNLILHDERNGTRWLSASEFARLLPTSVRLVCLSTCVTAENYQMGGLAKFAHCSAEIPLPTAIVNQYALTPAGAANFWRTFYPALIRHDGNVVEAAHEARLTVHKMVNDTWDWASFSLVVRDGTGHPLRTLRTAEPRQDRSADIQAWWANQLANNLALHTRSLDVETQKYWVDTLAAESARVESLERDIEDLEERQR